MHTWAPRTDFVMADAFAKRTLVEKLARSWSLVSADSPRLTVVDEEQVANAEVRLSPRHLMLLIFTLPYLNVSRLPQALAQALKVATLRSFVCTLEGGICNLESLDALLRGQIGDLQPERQRSDEVAAKYKRHLEKLKREKEALEAKTKDL